MVPGMPRAPVSCYTYSYGLIFKFTNKQAGFPAPFFLHLTYPTWDVETNSRSRIEARGNVWALFWHNGCRSHSILLSSLKWWMTPFLFSLVLLRDEWTCQLSDLSSLNRCRLPLELPPGWAPIVAHKDWSPQFCSQMLTILSYLIWLLHLSFLGTLVLNSVGSCLLIFLLLTSPPHNTENKLRVESMSHHGYLSPSWQRGWLGVAALIVLPLV